LLLSTRTGLWRTGPELFGHMKQKSIGLGQMKEYICEKRKMHFYKARREEVS